MLGTAMWAFKNYVDKTGGRGVGEISKLLKEYYYVNLTREAQGAGMRS